MWHPPPPWKCDSLKAPLVVSGLSTRQPNSEIQDMILTNCDKKWKIKNSWKRSSHVFNMMRITFHYIAIHQKKKNFFSCTLKYNFEQLNHCWTNWNGSSSMKWCSKNVQMHALASFGTRPLVQYQLNSFNSWHTEIPRPSPEMSTYIHVFT